MKSLRKKYAYIPIVSLTLASTDSASGLNDALPLQSHAYSWTEEVGWNVAEEIPLVHAVNKLKESIACNFSDPN